MTAPGLMAKRIAVFGGTFDPVHIGHLITARAVAEQRGFERITLVPAASPPHKRGALAAPEHRMAMLRLAVGDDPTFEICELELYRTGPSYTYRTLIELRDRHGPDAELYWIIGADMLASLHTWHRAKEVMDLARILVAARPPWPGKADELLAGLAGPLGPQNVEQLRRSIVETPLIDISSTELRRRIAAGRPVRYFIPEHVITYIDKHGLYR